MLSEILDQLAQWFMVSDMNPWDVGLNFAMGQFILY